LESVSPRFSVPFRHRASAGRCIAEGFLDSVFRLRCLARTSGCSLPSKLRSGFSVSEIGETPIHSENLSIFWSDGAASRNVHF